MYETPLSFYFGWTSTMGDSGQRRIIRHCESPAHNSVQHSRRERSDCFRFDSTTVHLPDAEQLPGCADTIVPVIPSNWSKSEEKKQYAGNSNATATSRPCGQFWTHVTSSSSSLSPLIPSPPLPLRQHNLPECAPRASTRPAPGSCGGFPPSPTGPRAPPWRHAGCRGSGRSRQRGRRRRARTRRAAPPGGGRRVLPLGARTAH
jgi:hypothetical protein